MNVKQCEACEHYRRITWTVPYQPKGYHKIGMTHAYGYCALHNKRCLNVKKGECQEGDKQ